MNRQYLDPVFHGRYPEELREIFGEAWAEPSSADMELIRQPLDFLGINYYTRSVVAHDPGAPPTDGRRVPHEQHLHTEMEWEVYAPALTRILLRVTDEYGPIPLFVTENGAAFRDPPAAIAGQVEDPLRVSYLREHIGATLEAIRQGADVRGYFAWSLLDNYEWSHGYSKRFGIVHVDFATQARTVKSSGRFYSEVIAANR